MKQHTKIQLMISTVLLCMTLLSGCGKESREPPIFEYPDPEQPPGVEDPRAHEDTTD